MMSLPSPGSGAARSRSWFGVICFSRESPPRPGWDLCCTARSRGGGSGHRRAGPETLRPPATGAAGGARRHRPGLPFQRHCSLSSRHHAAHAGRRHRSPREGPQPRGCPDPRSPRRDDDMRISARTRVPQGLLIRWPGPGRHAGCSQRARPGGGDGEVWTAAPCSGGVIDASLRGSRGGALCRQKWVISW